MSSVSSVQTNTAAAPVASTQSAEAAKPIAKPASMANAGPAATLQLSQQALAKLKGDKDWQPGAKIDSF
jgi:hypothetical protein